MSLILESQSNESQQKGNNELIQLLIDEIIFLGHCYGKAKSLYQQRIIRNGGSKLQKILNKQKKLKSKMIPLEEFQRTVKQIHDTINDVIDKI
ncbi:MAG: hypothetical protein ACFFAH_07035 [Promethearchaeota archaeon]